MRSTLSPSLGNAYLGFYEQMWLNYCSEVFKPIYYRRYIDLQVQIHLQLY